MIGPTHLFFALALAYILRLPKVPAAIGGIIPDLDVLLQGDFPLMHRGLVHTPLIMAISMVMLYLVFQPPIAFSFGMGFLSHLFLDIANPTGIMLFYPLPAFFTLNLAVYNNVAANLGIMAWSLAAILACRSEAFQGWIGRVFGAGLEIPAEAKAG
jgi:inner membrane protein